MIFYLWDSIEERKIHHEDATEEIIHRKGVNEGAKEIGLNGGLKFKEGGGEGAGTKVTATYGKKTRHE